VIQTVYRATVYQIRVRDPISSAQKTQFSHLSRRLPNTGSGLDAQNVEDPESSEMEECATVCQTKAEVPIYSAQKNHHSTHVPFHLSNTVSGLDAQNAEDHESSKMEECATVCQTKAEVLICSAQKNHHSTHVPFHLPNTVSGPDAQNAEDHESSEMEECATVCQTKAKVLICNAQKNHSTHVPFHLSNTGSGLDAQNAEDPESPETEECATVCQTKAEVLIFSAQKNHSTHVPFHLSNTGSGLDAQNAEDHESSETEECATVCQTKAEVLIFSAQKNHSTHVPFHLPKTGTLREAQNAADQQASKVEYCATM